MVGSIPSQQDRINAASAGTQLFKMPIWTLFFNQSEAQVLLIQGLSNKISIEIDFEPSTNIVQADSTYGGPLVANVCASPDAHQTDLDRFPLR